MIISMCLLMTSSTPATVGTYTKVYATATGSEQDITIDFEFFADSEIVVTSRNNTTGNETTLVKDTDYRLEDHLPATGDPYTSATCELINGQVTVNHLVTVSRTSARTQTTDLETGGPLEADTLEDRFDKLTLLVQELEEKINRSIRIPITDYSDDQTIEDDMELLDSIDRANAYLTFDSDGSPSLLAGELDSSITVNGFMETPLTSASLADWISNIGYSADMQTFLDDANLTTMKATLGITALTGAIAVDSVAISGAGDATATTEFLWLKDTGSTSGVKVHMYNDILYFSTVNSSGVHQADLFQVVPNAGIKVMGTKLDMNSKPIENLQAGNEADEAIRYDQVDDSSIEMDGSNNISVKDGGITNAMLADEAAFQPMGSSPTGTQLWDGDPLEDGNTPTSWTDLNINSKASIGAQRTLVFLYCLNHGGADRGIKFRENGSADDIGESTWTTAMGTSGGKCDDERGIYVMVSTDASGIVEWITTAGVDWDIFLVGYIR